MRFNILTIFPEMFEMLNTSIISRAIKNKFIELNVIDIRDFANNKHNKVDDTPYGGGPGMVMMPDVIFRAFNSFEKRENHVCIYVSPKGKTYSQKQAISFLDYDDITILCGHYEGVDQRVLDKIVDIEVSIGDYILTGGEIPAMVIVDSVTRLIPNVISEDSINDETFANNLLEYPQYTKPLIFENEKVPDVLLSGNHKEISKWRLEKSLELTKKNRPDLLKGKE